MNYDAKYFIKKFEAIPEEMWVAGEIVGPNFESCALGHCVMEGTDGYLSVLLKYNAAEINDGEVERYQQDTPKQRILAALRDVKNEVF